jgi:two-component system, OmpR family, alkaline phosphatase synthesis response regulator PhoP
MPWTRRVDVLAGAQRHRLLFHPESSSGGGGRTQDGSARVLVVDDEAPIRTICRINLEASGIAVLEAESGERALELARTERPILILLDVMMPQVDGWEVAERLSAGAVTRDIPVVFLSARTAPEDRREAQRLGAVGYIVKPFDPLQLGETVERVLDRLRSGERERLRQEVAAGA